MQRHIFQMSFFICVNWKLFPTPENNKIQTLELTAHNINILI